MDIKKVIISEEGFMKHSYKWNVCIQGPFDCSLHVFQGVVAVAAQLEAQGPVWWHVWSANGLGTPNTKIMETHLTIIDPKVQKFFSEKPNQPWNFQQLYSVR